MQEKTLQLQAGNRADSDTFSTLTADVPFRAALSLACSFQLFSLSLNSEVPVPQCRPAYDVDALPKLRTNRC